MPTYNVLLPAPSVSLPTGVENVAGECRLATQYPFSGGTLEFDGETAGPPSGWTYSGGMTTDTGISARNRFSARGVIGGGYASGVFLTRGSIVGNWDVFGSVDTQFLAGDTYFSGLIAGNLADANQLVSQQFRSGSGPAHATYLVATSPEAIDGMNLNNEAWRTRIWYRLRRVGSQFTGFYQRAIRPTSAGMSQLGQATLGAVPSSISVGYVTHTSSASINGFTQFEPLRSWPPFLTTSPQIARDYASDSNSTAWDLATFTERPTCPIRDFASAGATKLYSYVCSNSIGASFTTSDVSLATLQSGGTLTGRYFRLGVKLVASTGFEDTRWNGATINVVASSVSSGGLIVPADWSGGFAA
jgi:hypothetical protein